MTLAEQVLNKLAKEQGIKNWERFRKCINNSDRQNDYEKDLLRAVELALLTKQAEVVKEINKLVEEDCFVDNHDDDKIMSCKTCANTKACGALRKLQKHLLAKSEAKKRK